MSGESSTRWKSSRMRTAPCSAIAGSSRRKTSSHGLARRPAHRQVAEQRRRRRRERRVVLAARGDQVVQERDPVAVVLVEPVPEGPQPGPPREVGEQRRLAVARVGEEQDHSPVDLGPQPVEEPVRASVSSRSGGAGPSRAGSGTRSSVAEGSCETGRAAGSPWTDQRSPGPSVGGVGRQVRRRERYGAALGGVNGRDRVRAWAPWWRAPLNPRLAATVAAGPALAVGVSPRIRSRS